MESYLQLVRSKNAHAHNPLVVLWSIELQTRTAAADVQKVPCSKSHFFASQDFAIGYEGNGLCNSSNKVTHQQR
jgi:hypothetical protein